MIIKIYGKMRAQYGIDVLILEYFDFFYTNVYCFNKSLTIDYSLVKKVATIWAL